MTLPSLWGLMPRSLAWIAFSMSAAMLGSKGLISSMRASCTDTLATDFSGFWVP